LVEEERRGEEHVVKEKEQACSRGKRGGMRSARKRGKRMTGVRWLFHSATALQ